jgi:hypothetical protein
MSLFQIRCDGVGVSRIKHNWKSESSLSSIGPRHTERTSEMSRLQRTWAAHHIVSHLALLFSQLFGAAYERESNIDLGILSAWALHSVHTSNRASRCRGSNAPTALTVESSCAMSGQNS